MLFSKLSTACISAAACALAAGAATRQTLPNHVPQALVESRRLGPVSGSVKLTTAAEGDRASYEFAIASAAVALELQGDTVQQVRIGLGGIAYRPWRAVEAEQALNGQPLTEANVEAAATVALRGAQTHGFNDYKPELARRTLVRALLETKTMSVSQA